MHRCPSEPPEPAPPNEADALARAPGPAVEEGLDPEVMPVLLAVPELAPTYLRLVQAADGDPGAAAVLEELADFVADLLGEVRHHHDVLERCLGAVEEVAASSADASELVTWSFLDSLAPDERAALGRFLGPRARALARPLDGPP